MDYLKYIFSDKKAATYWIIYYSFLALLLLFGFVIKNYGEQNNEQTDIISVVFWIIIIFILLFAFILFYSFSFINYRLQQTFLLPETNNAILSVNKSAALSANKMQQNGN